MRIKLDLPDDTKIIAVTTIRDTGEKLLVQAQSTNIKDGGIYKVLAETVMEDE